MDVREFSKRVRDMERKLYRTAKCILKNDTDAADAVQEALLSAWRNLSSLSSLPDACRSARRGEKRLRLSHAAGRKIPAARNALSHSGI